MQPNNGHKHTQTKKCSTHVGTFTELWLARACSWAPMPVNAAVTRHGDVSNIQTSPPTAHTQLGNGYTLITPPHTTLC